MTTDERLTKLEERLTRGRRLNRCLLAALSLCLAAWALVGSLQPKTASASAIAQLPGQEFDPPEDDQYYTSPEGGTSGLVVIVVLGTILGVGAILVWIEERPRRDQRAQAPRSKNLKPPKGITSARLGQPGRGLGEIKGHKPQEAGTRAMTAVVDAELCPGCGLCVQTCPAVFEMGDDDVAVVTVNEVPNEWADSCREAAEDCPTEAIAIEE